MSLATKGNWPAHPQMGRFSELRGFGMARLVGRRPLFERGDPLVSQFGDPEDEGDPFILPLLGLAARFLAPIVLPALGQAVASKATQVIGGFIAPEGGVEAEEALDEEEEEE